MIYSDNTFDITNNIATYTRRDFKSVFDTTSNKWYMLNNLNNYEEYGIYGDSLSGTYYPGKLVIVNNEEYEWDGTEWDDLGTATGEQRNVKFSEYFATVEDMETKSIDNVHWDMSRPAGTGNEDVYFSYSGPNQSSLNPRFTMYWSGGVYTDGGQSNKSISSLPQDSSGFYYRTFTGGNMYLAKYSSLTSLSQYLNYTTWNYAYTYINTINYPKYYTPKTAPTITNLWGSKIYRNSNRLYKLYRNEDEQTIWDYKTEEILKRGKVAIPYIHINAEDATVGKKSYFDLNYIPTSTTNVEITLYMAGSPSTTTDTYIFGQNGNRNFYEPSNGYGARIRANRYSSDGVYYFEPTYANSFTDQATSLTNNGDTLIRMDQTTNSGKFTLYKDGTQVLQYDLGTCSNNIPFYLFAGNALSGSIQCAIPEEWVREVKIYEGTTLVRHYIPSTNNGENGLLEKVQNTFISPTGTGKIDIELI